MGEVVGAGLLAHVPTIMLPRPDRLDLNEGREISLVPGLERLRAEVFEVLDYDTVVVLRLALVHHRGVRDLRPRGQGRAVHLRRAAPRYVPDPLRLARRSRAGPRGRRARRQARHLDHRDRRPVPAAALRRPSTCGHYLGRGLGARWVSVSNTAETGDTEDFLRAGRALGEAIAQSDRRVLLLASGALSHTFWPLRELRAHEASDPVHIRTAQARAADAERIAWLEAGDHARVLDTMPEFLRVRPEAKFAHYLMMVAALGEAGRARPGPPVQRL